LNTAVDIAVRTRIAARNHDLAGLRHDHPDGAEHIGMCCVINDRVGVGGGIPYVENVKPRLLARLICSVCPDLAIRRHDAMKADQWPWEHSAPGTDLLGRLASDRERA